MAIQITPNNQIRNLDPYQQKLFQYDSIDSRVYLAKETNRLLRVAAGDSDAAIQGLNVIVSNRTSNGFNLTIKAGSCVVDNTLIEFPVDIVTTVDYSSTSVSENINGSYVVFVSYQYLQTTLDNPARIKLLYKNQNNSFSDDPAGYDPNRDRLILAEIPIDTNESVKTYFGDRVTYMGNTAASTDPFSDGSLIVLYRFNNNFNDELGNHNGNGYGDYIFTEGILDNCVDFGTEPNDTKYVRVDNIPLGTSYSFSFWINKHYNNTVSNSIISIADSGAANRLLIGEEISENRINIWINDNVYHTNVTPINCGEWLHFCYTQDGDTATIYLNAQQVGRVTGTQNLSLNASNVMILGQDQDSVGGGFDPTQCLLGALDEFRIFTRALSQAEINALYASVFPEKRSYIFGLKQTDLPPFMQSYTYLLNAMMEGLEVEDGSVTGGDVFLWSGNPRGIFKRIFDSIAIKSNP